MLSEVYEEIPLPNGQKITISRRGKHPVELHLVSKAKLFLSLEEAEEYAEKLKEEAKRKRDGSASPPSLKPPSPLYH